MTNLYQDELQDEQTANSIIEDFKTRWLAGENPDLDSYLNDLSPKVANHIREYINGWIWLKRKDGTMQILRDCSPVEEQLAELRRRIKAQG